MGVRGFGPWDEGLSLVWLMINRSNSGGGGLVGRVRVGAAEEDNDIGLGLEKGGELGCLVGLGQVRIYYGDYMYIYILFFIYKKRILNSDV